MKLYHGTYFRPDILEYGLRVNQKGALYSAPDTLYLATRPLPCLGYALESRKYHTPKGIIAENLDEVFDEILLFEIETDDLEHEAAAGAATEYEYHYDIPANLLKRLNVRDYIKDTSHIQTKEKIRFEIDFIKNSNMSQEFKDKAISEAKALLERDKAAREKLQRSGTGSEPSKTL